MSLFSALIDEDVLGRRSRASANIQIPPVAKREVFIAIRRDGIVGDGTRENPYNGSDRDTLDAVLNGDLDPTLQAPIRFVFGPGIFRTGGGWQNSDPTPPSLRIWFGVFP